MLSIEIVEFCGIKNMSVVKVDPNIGGKWFGSGKLHNRPILLFTDQDGHSRVDQ